MFFIVARLRSSRSKNPAKVASYKRDPCALHGYVCTGPHRNSDLCLGERRCVVDSVTRHCDNSPRRLKVSNHLSLFAGQDLGTHFIQAKLPSYRFCRGSAVAGEHDHPDAVSMKPLDCCWR
jgi:hypothetical protein